MSPVHPYLDPKTALSQRIQYEKPGVGRWYWDLRDRLLLSWSGPGPTVDLGCGEGITLERLVSTPPSQGPILGIDLDPTNAGICRVRGLPFLRADLEALPLATGSIGTIFWLEVIEHLDHPRKVLREIHRVLKPDGRLIVLFPNDLGFLAARLATFRWREAMEDPHHIRQWTPGRLRRFLEAGHFRIEAERAMPLDCWPWALHFGVLAQPSRP